MDGTPAQAALRLDVGFNSKPHHENAKMRKDRRSGNTATGGWGDETVFCNYLRWLVPNTLQDMRVGRSVARAVLSPNGLLRCAPPFDKLQAIARHGVRRCG